MFKFLDVALWCQSSSSSLLYMEPDPVFFLSKVNKPWCSRLVWLLEHSDYQRNDVLVRRIQGGIVGVRGRKKRDPERSIAVGFVRLLILGRGVLL